MLSIGIALFLFDSIYECCRGDVRVVCNVEELEQCVGTAVQCSVYCLGGLFFIAVFMKRVKGYAALAGFIAGEAVVFGMSEWSNANFLLFGATGMLVSIAVAWLLSIGSYFGKSK